MLFRSIVLCAALLAPTPQFAVAAPPGTFPGPDNAALVYYRYWSMISPEQTERLNSDDYLKPDWKPTDDVKKELESLKGVAGGIVRGSLIAKCDFGMEWDQGWSALMPHLSKLRVSVRILGQDARVKAGAGEQDAAAANLAAMLRIAGQGATEQVLISSLVAVANAKAAATTALTLHEAGQLTAAGREQIIKAAEALLTPDPFGGKACVTTERFITTEWIRRLGKNGGKELAAFFKKDMGMRDDAEAIKQLESMSAKDVQEWCSKLQSAYDGFEAAWDKPDAVELMSAHFERITKGEGGPLGQLLAPDLGRARKSIAEGEKSIRDLVAKLRAAAPSPK